MEQLLLYIKNLDLNWHNLSITATILTFGCIITGVVSRAVFGKRSVLFESASSAVGILFIYAITAVICSIGTSFIPYTAPLPFVTITKESLTFINLYNTDYTVVFGMLLNMVVLSFVMNITDRLLPKGKNFFLWTLLRCVTVLAAMLLHIIANGLIKEYLPEGIINYAPIILLGLLVIMLLTGALKIVVGTVLTVIDPIAGALYTFFFANIIGRQVTKAVFTTGILTALFLLLTYLQIDSISIQPGALIAYIPYACILLICWYGIKKFEYSA